MSGIRTKQVVARELQRWLQAEREAQQLSCSDLEDATQIKRWGKWAALGEHPNQGIKRQLKFRARTRESMSAWDAIVPLDDVEALRIEEALSHLPATDRQVLRRLYVYWQSTRYASQSMIIPREQLMDRRDMALAFIAGHLRSATRAPGSSG